MKFTSEQRKTIIKLACQFALECANEGFVKRDLYKLIRKEVGLDTNYDEYDISYLIEEENDAIYEVIENAVV